MKEITVIIEKIDREYLERYFDTLVETLYPERREKVLHFKRREAAYISMAAGLLLQRVERKVLGIEPENLILERGQQGKPRIQGKPEFYFNLSHSGDYVVLAYGTSPVGVDIEQKKMHDLKVAKRCFTEAEYGYVVQGYDGNLEDLKRNAPLQYTQMVERFTKLWTMKESYLKLTGQGISVPLSSFEVDMDAMCVKDTNVKYVQEEMKDYFVMLCVEKCEGVDFSYTTHAYRGA